MFTKKVLGSIIKKKKVLFIAMVFLVLLSSFLSTGFSTAYYAFKSNTSKFINECVYPDITLTTQDNFSKEDIKTISDVEGVDCYTPRSYFFKAAYISDSIKTIKITSYSEETFTKFYVVDSVSPSENFLNVYVDFAFAKNANIGVGNLIKLYGGEEEKGTYVHIQKIIGSTETMYPMIQYGFEVDKYNFGFMFASDSDLQSSKFQSDFKYNEIIVKVKDGYSQNNVADHIKETLSKLIKPIDVKTTVLKDNSMAISYINSVISQFHTVAILIPLVFVLVTMLLLVLFEYEILKSLTRELGIFNALGIQKKNLFNLLFSFNLSVTIIGATIGILGGFGFANFMYNMCKYSYSMPYGMADFNVVVSLVCFAAFILIAVITSLFSLFSLRKLSPKEVMVNAMDKNVQLPKKIDDLTKSSTSLNLSVNSMHKNKARFIISLCAVLLSTAISYCALSYSRSENYYIQELSERMRYDAQVFSTSNSASELDKLKEALSKYTDKSEYLYTNYLTFTFNNKSIESAICGVEKDSSLLYIPGGMKPTGEGIILDASYANTLGAKVGDKITVQIDSTKTKDITIDAISNICSEKYIYMSLEAYENFFSDSSSSGYKTLLIDFNNEYKNDIYLTSIENNGLPLYTSEVIKTYSTGTRLVMIVAYVCVFLSLSVSFITLLIMCMASLEDQKRKLSTLRILGFSVKDTYKVFKLEIIIYLILGLIPGIPLGIGFTYLLVFLSCRVDYTLPVLYIWWIFIATILFVFLVILLNLIIGKRKITNWDIASNTRNKE